MLKWRKIINPGPTRKLKKVRKTLSIVYGQAQSYRQIRIDLKTEHMVELGFVGNLVREGWPSR